MVEKTNFSAKADNLVHEAEKKLKGSYIIIKYLK